MVRALRNVLARAVVLGLIGAAGVPLAAAAAVTGPGPNRPVAVSPRTIQLGVGVDLYAWPALNYDTASAAEVAYVKALHANSVMVSFPFFVSSRKSSAVYATVRTPAPAQLAVFARLAMSQGLYVVLRPLMDQGGIAESRADWAPPDPQAWFASYQKFLLPYATMAQQAGIPEFYVGAEFSRFQTLSYWNGLDQALRQVYKGKLMYANNGGGVHSGEGGDSVTRSADAYPDLNVPDNVTVGRLTRRWAAYDRRLPARTALSEVGISGVRGAFKVPWQHHWPHPRLDASVQTRWFEAACHAAVAQHLGGIYFWAIGFGPSQLNTTLSAKNQGAWEDGPAERAVATCYSQVREPAVLTQAPRSAGSSAPRRS